VRVRGRLLEHDDHRADSIVGQARKPAPVRVAGLEVRWRRLEIDAWIADQ